MLDVQSCVRIKQRRTEPAGPSAAAPEATGGLQPTPPEGDMKSMKPAISVDVDNADVAGSIDHVVGQPLASPEPG